MRLFRLILFDLALMLLAPEVAEGMNTGVGAHFTSATSVVAPFERIACHEAVSSSGDSRRVYSQTTQAAPVQPADELNPAKLAEDSAIPDARLACVIGKRFRQRSIATILDDREMLKMPAVVTPSICNAAAAPFGLLEAETPRWSETDWIVGGMVIIAFAIIILVVI
ncbi:hypothetical protein H8B02_19745 [Bradyrhizobium sp. Pear77]|uniref:hypothetical protein n=1 Tax=Bradyrhizobium altum TaxID=1571202 RepID=UPI001E3F2CCE|nr:hypothetical protein [Bradyrhizobium altum]MCC8955583.1 hypothetical protein [Bradyrhizobium altum]